MVTICACVMALVSMLGAPAFADEIDAQGVDDKTISAENTATSEPEPEPLILAPGWNFDESGMWYYADAHGVARTGWLQTGGVWYYLDPEAHGAMVTGWLDEGGSRYFLKSSGAMATGWVLDGGTWYWANGSGRISTGWLWTGGRWYWLEPSAYGAMSTGVYSVGREWFTAGSDGSVRLSGWSLVNGTWYYVDSRGATRAGWLRTGGSWYYLNPAAHGAMVTGWLDEGGSRYFLKSSGAMVTGWVLDGGTWYWANGSGRISTGWLWTGGKWYWLEPSARGAMSTGVYSVRNEWFTAGSDGSVRLNGWSRVGNTWYYADSCGATRTGWLRTGGAWYYLDPASHGSMATGLFEVAGTKYFANNSGAMASNAWVSTGSGCGFAESSGAIRQMGAYTDKGQIILLDNAGVPLIGWATFSNHRFYANESGVMVTGWRLIDNVWYYFNNQGIMQTGWLSTGGAWYYLDPSGAMATGWRSVGGSWYYLDAARGGAMRSSGWSWVGSTDYKFASSGRMVGAWVDVPCYMQYPELPTGCESVALTDLLAYYGYRPGKTTIASQWLKKSSWDFVTAFAGNPFVASNRNYDACVAPAIVNAGNGYLASKGNKHEAVDVSGSSPASIRSYLSNGIPVEVWTTENQVSPSSSTVSQWYGGHRYMLFANTHAVVVKGYDEERGIVYTSDPIAGSVERDASRFFSIYNAMDRQAVIVRSR